MRQQNPKVLLLSIKPEYVNKILDGQKTVELRKTRPKIKEGDFILVYASSPQKSLVGWAEVQNIVCDSPKKLWKEVQYSAGITKQEFDSYYQKSRLGIGISIKFNSTQKLSLEKVRERWHQFKPPQSFYYLKEDEVLLAEEITEYSLPRTSETSQLNLLALTR